MMVEARRAGVGAQRHDYRTDYRWASLEQISPHAAIAVVASEDQLFPFHAGFDLNSIREAVRASEQGKHLRGASTISQQVAKNLFLWSGHSFVRKGLEAYFTVLIEALWPKERILEMYLNIAQFGDGIYGVQAAAQRFWHKTARSLSSSEAAPAGRRAAQPGADARRPAVALRGDAARPDPGRRCATWVARPTCGRWNQNGAPRRTEGTPPPPPTGS